MQRKKQFAPEWVCYDDRETCECCHSFFTWASTSDNKAQEARDKKNCRSCGALVCAKCSEKKMSLSNIGIEQRVRVCDSCFFSKGKKSADIEATRSLILEGEGGAIIGGNGDSNSDSSDSDDSDSGVRIVNKSKRRNTRRKSVIVENLVANLNGADINPMNE